MYLEYILRYGICSIFSSNKNALSCNKGIKLTDQFGLIYSFFDILL